MTGFGYKLDVSSLFQIRNRSLRMERAIHIFSCGSCYCSHSIIPSPEYIFSPLLKTKGWLFFCSSVPGAPLESWSSWHSDPSAHFQGKHSLDRLLCQKSFFAGVLPIFFLIFGDVFHLKLCFLLYNEENCALHSFGHIIGVLFCDTVAFSFMLEIHSGSKGHICFFTPRSHLLFVIMMLQLTITC